MNRTPAWLLFGVLSACASANEQDVTSAGPEGLTSASFVGARSEPKAASSARPTKRAVEPLPSSCVEGEVRKQDCNTCTCSNAFWACTEKGCGD